MAQLLDVINYAYSNARVRAKKSNLLDEKTIRSCVDAKDIASYASVLEGTSYRPAMQKLENIDAMNIEGALLKSLIETDAKVTSLAPTGARDFLGVRSMKYEIMAIKEIINSKAAEEAQDERIKSHSFMCSKQMRILLPRLIDTKDIEDIVDIVKRTQYGKPLAGALGSHKGDGSVLPFMLSLDMHYFTSLWAKLKTLNKTDQKICKMLIGIEVDAVNILTVLRSKTQDFDANKFLIPVGYAVKIEKCMGEEDVPEVLKSLAGTIYARALTSSMPAYEKTGSLMAFELGLKRLLVERTIEGLSGYPFQIGSLVGYLKLKDTEIENLRAIAVGVENNLPPDDIRGLLI